MNAKSARLLAGIWAGALIVLSAYVWQRAIGVTTHGFIAYYAAARLFVTGQFGPQVYDDVWFMQYVKDLTGTGVQEIYGPNTPAMALLALPIAWLGPSGARSVFLVASLAGLALASAALIRHTIRGGAGVPALGVAVLLLSPAVFANLRTGQAYLLIFAALSIAALCLVRRQDAVGGGLIGLVLILKSSGLPLLLLLAVQRRTRAVVAAITVCLAGALIILLVSGLDIWLRYPAYVWEFLQRPSTSVTAYQTTRSLFKHLCVGDAVWNPAPAANCGAVASIVPGLLIAGAMVVTAVASRRSRPELWIAAGVCLSVLAVPVGAEQHSVLLGLALIVVPQVRARLVSVRGAWRWWPWVVVAALLIVPLEYTAYRFTDGWSALAAYPRLYAAWGLWGLTIREMVRRDWSADGTTRFASQVPSVETA